MTHVPHPLTAERSDSDWYRPFSFESAWSIGWTTFKSKYTHLLKVTAVYALLYIATAYVAGLIDRRLVGPNPVLPPFSTLMNWLVLAPLAIGLTYSAAAAVRGRRSSLEDLLIGFRRYFTVIGVIFLVGLITYGFIIVMALFGGFAGAAAGSTGGSVGFVVVFIPVMIVMVIALIYLGVRLWFAGILAVDPEGPRPGVIDSIKLSWTITRGRVLSLFLVSLVAGLIVVLSLLMLILPAIFFGGPLAIAVFGAAYAQIAAQTGTVPLHNVCARCGYPTPTGSVCPECGEVAGAPTFPVT